MSKSTSSRSDALSETKDTRGLICFPGSIQPRSGRTAPFADRYTTDLYLSPPIEDTYSDNLSWNRSPVHNRFDITRKQQLALAVSTPPTRYLATPPASPSRRSEQRQSPGPRPPPPSSQDPPRLLHRESHTSKVLSSESRFYGDADDEQVAEIYETESVKRERSSPRMSEKLLYRSELSPVASKVVRPGWMCASAPPESEKSSPMADRSSEGSSEHLQSPEYGDDIQSNPDTRTRWCPSIPKRQARTRTGGVIESRRRASEGSNSIQIVRQSLPSKKSHETVLGSAANPLMVDYMGSTQKRTSVSELGNAASGSIEAPARKSFTGRLFRVCRDSPANGLGETEINVGERETKVLQESSSRGVSPRSEAKLDLAREMSVVVSEDNGSPRNVPGAHASFEDGPSPNGYARTGMFGMCCLGGRSTEKTDRYRLSLPAETIGDEGLSPLERKHQQTRIEMSEDLITYRDPHHMKPAEQGSFVDVLDFETGRVASKHVEALRGSASVGYAMIKSNQERKFASHVPLHTENYLAVLPGGTFVTDVLSGATAAAKRKYQGAQSGRVAAWTSKKFTLTNHAGKALGLAFELGVDGILRSSLLLPADTSLPTDHTYFDVCQTITSRTGASDPVVCIDKYVTLSGYPAIPIKYEESFSIHHDDLLERVDDHTQILVMVTVIHVGDRGGLCQEISALYGSAAFNQPPTPIADVNVVCENQVCPALRGVLMARSTVFNEMLKNKSRAVIAVTGASSVIVRNMIDYCHTDTCALLTTGETDLPAQLKLFETAVRFGVESLANELYIQILPRLQSSTSAQIRQAAQKTGHIYLMETLTRYERTLTSPPLKVVEEEPGFNSASGPGSGNYKESQALVNPPPVVVTQHKSLSSSSSTSTSSSSSSSSSSENLNN